MFKRFSVQAKKNKWLEVKAIFCHRIVTRHLCSRYKHAPCQYGQNLEPMRDSRFGGVAGYVDLRINRRRCATCDGPRSKMAGRRTNARTPRTEGLWRGENDAKEAEDWAKSHSVAEERRLGIKVSHHRTATQIVIFRLSSFEDRLI